MAFRYTEEEVACCLDPLVAEIHSRHRADDTTIVGIQGGQGTGKSTIAAYLTDKLRAEGFGVVSFSIDDFYTSSTHRKQLAANRPDNPFYQIPRGMPGTHEVEELFTALTRLKAGEDVDLPVFDKSAGNGRGERSAEVKPARGRQDFAILEGWCVGMPQCSADELIEICHQQELSGVDDLLKPKYLGEVLAEIPPYERLWQLIDLSVMLRPVSLSLHEEWRLQQERELIASRGTGMADDEVRTLVRHFQPFACLCYAKMKADLCIRIDAEHRLQDLPRT